MRRTMLDPSAPTSYRARWVVPIDGPPIAHGVVTVRGGRIVSVGAKTDAADVVDLGNVAILPALVNAHTHLEFSLFERPFGQPGTSFAGWLRELVNWRREQPAVQGQMEMALERGLAESRAAGTVALGEIATPLFSERWSWQRQAPNIVFMELLSLNPERVQPLAELADQFTIGSNHDARCGLSPHAPYTVHPELLVKAAQLSAERGIPLEMHVAESREELELLSSQTGPLVELLKSLAAWYPQSLSLGLKPIDFLHALADAHRAVIAHGNYLNAEEIAYVAEKRTKLSIAYCPRTQAYFDHDPYPLEAMLKSGVRVAIGTDSRASNPDLSVWNELKFVRARYPALDPLTVLKMGTLSAAEALGIEDDYGSLTPGKVDALAIVDLPDERCESVEQIFTGVARPSFAW